MEAYSLNFYWFEALYILLALPIFAWFIWRAYQVYQRRLQSLLGYGLASMAPKISRPRQFGKGLILLLSLAVLIFALARPRWGFEERELTRQGLDLIVAIDVSQSMKAQDLRPDRLSRAKREIIDLLRVMAGDRIGLIPFAGVAFVQCPLTVDYQAVDLFLRQMDTDLIPVPGTAIGDAIRLATASLAGVEADTSSGKALILITDGEDHSSEALNAAKEAAKAGIQIYTVGIGALEGAPIPGDSGEFLRDAAGQVVISRMDDGLLRQIAEMTGGYHVRATADDIGLADIYLSRIKGSLGEGEIYKRQERVWHERFFWFSALAMLLLFIEFFLPE